MKVLAAQGATFFFDQDADFVQGTSSTLRTEFIFGLPATGTDGSFAAGRDLYEELCKGAAPPAPARSSLWSALAALPPVTQHTESFQRRSSVWPADMYDILTAADEGPFRVTFGGDVMTDWEIRQQLLSDSRFVAIAIAIAIVMLAVATRSPFLTAFALLQILASFPIAYSLYAATGNTSLSIIQFLSPFVILGIGLDDVFVFVGIYRALMAYSHRYDISTRLHVAWRRASGAMLATSATSAVAFAANAISPVPAVRLFGILLAALVATNYVLAVVWLPISVIVWEKHLRGCCGLFGSVGAAASAAKGSGAGSPVTTAATEPVPSGPLSHGVPTKAHVSKALPMHAQLLCSGRHFWRIIFNAVWTGRAVLIPCLLGASVAGAIFASRLEPSDSLPQLFDDDHNVQRFLDVWAANFTDDSIFACATCLLLSTSVDLESIAEVQLDFAPPAGATAGSGNGTAAPTGDGASTPAGPIAANTTAAAQPLANTTAPELASPPAVSPTGLTEPPPNSSAAVPPVADTPPGLVPLLAGSLANASGSPLGTPATSAPPPVAGAGAVVGLNTSGGAIVVDGGSVVAAAPDAAPAPAPVLAPGPLDLTPASASPLDAVNVDEEVLTAERVNLNTIPVAVIWGVRGVGGSNSSDPFSEDAASTIELDVAFDLGEVAQQKAVLAQVSDLVNLNNGRPQPGRDKLVSKMRWNVLEALQRFCGGPAGGEFYCSQLDPDTQLPVGDPFHIAAWAMLLSNYQGSFALSGRVCPRFPAVVYYCMVASSASAPKRLLHRCRCNKPTHIAQPRCVGLCHAHNGAVTPACSAHSTQHTQRAPCAAGSHDRCL